MPVIVQGQTTKIAGRKSPWYDGPECLRLRSMQKGWCRLGLQSLQHALRRQVALGQQKKLAHQWLVYMWPLEARNALPEEEEEEEIVTCPSVNKTLQGQGVSHYHKGK